MFHMEPAVGLRFDFSPHDVAGVREGLPVEIISEIAAKYGLSKQEVLEAAGIPRSSAYRYKERGRLNREQSNRLYKLIYLLRRAEELFGSAELAAGWMNSPKVFLHNASPLHYLDTEPGFKAVEHLLGRLEDGLVT
jgi:putative toxin-antitoxin system antitoxin component (TIGR02293 family)